VVLAGEFEHDGLVREPGAELVVDVVVLDGIGIEQISGEAEHHPMGSPVGHVQVCVVVTLHQPVRVTLEIAPVVLVHETGGGDPCPRGQRPDLSLLVIVQWSVDRQELVVLVLAHCPSAQSVGVKGSAWKLESSPMWKNK
jgi:hypothetical protein